MVNDLWSLFWNSFVGSHTNSVWFLFITANRYRGTEWFILGFGFI